MEFAKSSFKELFLVTCLFLSSYVVSEVGFKALLKENDSIK